jgi:hypothetical protein
MAISEGVRERMRAREKEQMGWQLGDAGSAAGMLPKELAGRGQTHVRASVRVGRSLGGEEDTVVDNGSKQWSAGGWGGCRVWTDGDYRGDRGEVIRRVELVKERGFPGAGSVAVAVPTQNNGAERVVRRRERSRRWNGGAGGGHRGLREGKAERAASSVDGRWR